MLVGSAVLGAFYRYHSFGSRGDVLRWSVVSLVWGLNLATSNLALYHASLGLVMVTRNWCAIPPLCGSTHKMGRFGL